MNLKPNHSIYENSPSPSLSHQGRGKALSRAIVIILVFGLILLVVSCAPAPSGPEKAGLVSTVDDAGRTVQAIRELQRIISLAPSNTEVLFALGLDDKIVGVTDYCDYPPAAKNKARVGGFSTINLEKVISLTPDLVLAANIHRQMVIPELERRGLAVFTLNRKTIDGVIDSLEIVGKLTATEKEASREASTLKARRDKVLSEISKYSYHPRVFYEISPQLHTAGIGTLIDDIIAKAGGINIAASVSGEYPQISREFLVLQDPEVILLADMGSDEMQTVQPVINRPGWRDLTAVKTGRVFIIAPNLTNRPSPRVIEGLEGMARIIHSK